MPTEADYSKYPQEIVEAWKAWGANKFWKPGKRELDDFALFSLGWEFAKEHESSQRTMPT